jgi:hypothetical protein
MNRSAAVRAFVAFSIALKVVVLVVGMVVEDADIPHFDPAVLRELPPVEIPTFAMPSVDPR